MPPKKKLPPVQQTAIGNDNIQVAGSNNIITRITNFFAGEKETIEQRNRRIMLGHVESFWVKGILEKSLHGAALLDLGIKEDPDALNYPWAIKREPNKEILPAGTSMLEIFQEIGMGRSLLILGAPGSGKTTMLLELTRQLIERAREDMTEPIPVVFNLSSWTEKLTLADWLARELNNIYSVPKKTAPTWVKENKMLLLLDGLDEVKQEYRDGCVNAINQFRKENGLTSMAVCSRIQDYAELKSRLSFDGAIEIQPLTSTQVDEYFEHHADQLAGVRQVLEKDTALREMAETPLFLGIMTLAYQDLESKNVLTSKDFDLQRQYLFNAYIARAFERRGRSTNKQFSKPNVLYWLSWLAQNMINKRISIFLLELLQQTWINNSAQRKRYSAFCGFISGVIFFGIPFGFAALLFVGMPLGLFLLIFSCLVGFGQFSYVDWSSNNVSDLGKLGFYHNFSLRGALSKSLIGVIFGLYLSISGLLVFLVTSLIGRLVNDVNSAVHFSDGLILFMLGPFFGAIFGLIGAIIDNAKPMNSEMIRKPNMGIRQSLNRMFIFWIIWFISGIILFNLLSRIILVEGAPGGITLPVMGLFELVGTSWFGGLAISQYYAIRLTLFSFKLIPLNYVPFLDYCVDLIFLRRVGGGYIFVHRLLMEHFAAMYHEEPK